MAKMGTKSPKNMFFGKKGTKAAPSDAYKSAKTDKKMNKFNKKDKKC